MCSVLSSLCNDVQQIVWMYLHRDNYKNVIQQYHQDVDESWCVMTDRFSNIQFAANWRRLETCNFDSRIYKLRYSVGGLRHHNGQFVTISANY